MELKINNQKQFRPDSLLFSLLTWNKQNGIAIDQQYHYPKTKLAFTFNET
jgi:RAB protein geranylgeranyltransferase component A